MAHDLRQLFRAVGRFSGQRALTSSPAERTDVVGDVEVLSEPPAALAGPGADVGAWVDGIQAAMVLTHRAHRPVYLVYVAAGAVDDRSRPLDVEEDLKIVCSHLDREWVDGLGSTVAVDEQVVDDPPQVEKMALRGLAGDRAHAEIVVCSRMQAAASGTVVVDGSLSGRAHDRALAGVVKTHATRYLPDERVLYGLPAGWRSPRFRLPAGVGGGLADRWSCYVRLFDASDAGWSFGLIRLETFDLDLLDRLGRTAIRSRQPPSSADARFDRHLAPIRACEDLLRARRPQVFSG